MNPNYALRVKGLHKLIAAKFHSHKDASLWLSPIVIIPKKSGALCICVDFHKLKAATKKGHYPLPDMEEIIDEVASNGMSSFINRISR